MMTMEPAAPSALLKSTIKDRMAFLGSPGCRIRSRHATSDEKMAAGLAATSDAAALLMKLCRGVLKIIVERRPLAGDVSEAARTFARLFGRPYEESLAAANLLPLVSPHDLAELGHWLMQIRPECKTCTCAGGYAPIVVALAMAAAEVSRASALNRHFEKLKGDRDPDIADGMKAAGDATRTIVAAAGYPEPRARIAP